LSSWVSFHLPLTSTLGYERGICAVPRERRRRFRGTRRHKLELVKDFHQLKKLSQGPVRRPAGLNSPATRSSAGFVMREIQTGLHKPKGGTKQRLTKSADNSAPVCFPNCASICLGSRVSFDLPLAQWPRSKRILIPEITAVHLSTGGRDWGVNWHGWKSPRFAQELSVDSSQLSEKTPPTTDNRQPSSSPPAAPPAASPAAPAFVQALTEFRRKAPGLTGNCI